MKYDPEKHHRRSIRLKEYDYSQSGAYFITICIDNWEIFLEEDDIKEMIESLWQKLPDKFKNISIDEFVIMPNHIHGIIFLHEHDSGNDGFNLNTNVKNDKTNVGADPRVCPKKGRTHRFAPTELKTMKYNPAKHKRKSIRLKEYDYSQPGAYFVTICTHNRLCLFGRIENDDVFLNECGNVTKGCLTAISDHYPDVTLDQFIISKIYS